VLGGTLVAVSGIVVLAWRGRSRLAWLATLALASLTVGLLVWRGARLEAGGAPATVAGSGRAPASSRPAPER
jgi:hypothetical protein